MPTRCSTSTRDADVYREATPSFRRASKRKKKFENSQRELGELCQCGPDDTRGCAGRRWTLGTALDQRRLTRTAATLLDGSAYQGHSLKEALG